MSPMEEIVRRREQGLVKLLEGLMDKARSVRDFETADGIRDAVIAAGYLVETGKTKTLIYSLS